VRRVLKRCLDRDTRTRIRDIADARLDLDEAFAEPTATEGAAAAASVPSRRRLPLGAGLAAAAAVGALLTALVLERLRPSAAQPPVVRSLTDSGRDWFPAASPDGKLVAFVSDRDGRQRIWLKQLPDGDETALTSGPDDRPRFSSDGSAVLFVRREGDGSSLFRIGVLGGEPRRLVGDAYDGAWSPDGRRLAFTREGRDGDRRSWALYVASADGSDPREIHRSTQGLFEWPVWSPDGKRIVCYPRFVGVSSGAWPLLLVDSSGSGSRPLDSSSLQARSPAVWLGEGDELLLARTSDVAGLDASPSDVYLINAQAGREAKVFASPNRISALDVLGRGRIVFDVNSNRYNLREVALAEGGTAAAWLTRGLGLNRQPRYAPDGDWILFSALRGDNLDVWSVQPRTGAVRRLTDSPAGDFDPALTSDGRQLIWSSDRGGHFEIWMGNADGSGARQVSHDGVDAENATATPDGKWIVYASGNPKKLGIWKVRSDGSEPTLLVPGLADWPEVSPDGKHVVFASERFTQQSAIRVVRLEDGAVLPFAIPLGSTIGRLGLIAGRARWTPDGRAIAFVNFDERGLPGVFVQEFVPEGDTSATRRALAGFDTEWAPETFAISPDGKKICLAEWEQVSSIMTAEGVPGVEPPVRPRAP
jgi:Tol biopolymer transport system component